MNAKISIPFESFNFFYLKLFPALRYIHAKKRGMPLRSGL